MYDKPLSYSGLSLYKKCPRAWHYAYILGVRRPPGAAAERGTLLHKQLEDYFNGHPYPMTDRVLKYWWSIMEELKDYNPTPEKGLAVDRHWNATTFDDPMANLRGNLDLCVEVGDSVWIYDWKSGKQYDSHADQSDLYAAMAWSACPESERVLVKMVYLDTPHYVVARNYDAAAIDLVIDRVEEEVGILRSDEAYLPTPSTEACKWCDLSWRRGGTCDKAP